MYQPSARDVVRITSYLLIFFALLVAILVVFLSQLDLNNYRTTLEQRISSALDQPVQIGNSSLTFSHGLALSFDELQIGSDKAPLAIIPHITATLRIPPLLKGNIVLDQVRVEDPEVQLHLPSLKGNKSGSSNQLLTSLGINILTIDGGHLKIYQKNQKKPSLTISKLYVVLEEWRAGHTGQLNISGNLDGYGSGFIFATRLPKNRDESSWRQEALDTKLTITNLSARSLISPALSGLPSHITMEVTVSGTPASGAALNAKLIDSAAKTPILSLAGRWVSTPDQEAITTITGELLKIPLSGKLYLLRKEDKNFLAGELNAQKITITPALLRHWYVSDSDQLISGQLKQLNLELKDNWKTGGSIAENLLLRGKLALNDFTWKDPRQPLLQDLSLNFSFKNESLAINDGTLVAHNQPIVFSGQITSLFQRPQIKLNASFNPLLDELTSQFKWPEGWRLSGHIPAQLKLEGALLSPHFILAADLTPIRTKIGSFFKKELTDQASLNLRGQLKENLFQLDSAILTLTDMTIAAKGYIQSTDSAQTFQLMTDPINLEKLQPFSPLLKQLAARGSISAEIFQQQQTGLQGVLNLSEVGAHLTSVIGDLNNTTGQIDLDQHGLTFQDLHASLGESAFTLTGILSQWDNPQLSLDLAGKKIRAHDLIFSNQQLTLYDLTGHLDINKDGLDFSPVNVRLEDETLATVTGNVRFSHPEVYLNIQSEQVNVLDVINLFSGPRQPHNNNVHHRIPVKIEAAAKKGTLGGLHFQNAKGLIVSDDKRLTIFPLKFDSGGGWCQTRILFEYDNHIAPLIISGHAEGVDATEIHQNLFERKGIISGPLNTDFYLEGSPTHGQFWKTAKGGIHAQITNGVLRKFRGLARVFSILNVSQLFSGKLPDMDKEGMPFTLAEGSIQLGDGQALTNDLKVDSDAMNLAIIGTSNLVDASLNLDLSVMPLGTVDSVVSSIPVAGWILTGKNKALVTAHFKISGTSENPKVESVPIGSVSDTVIGIVKRTFGLPGALVKDFGELIETKPQKKSTE